MKNPLRAEREHRGSYGDEDARATAATRPHRSAFAASRSDSRRAEMRICIDRQADPTAERWRPRSPLRPLNVPRRSRLARRVAVERKRRRRIGAERSCLARQPPRTGRDRRVGQGVGFIHRKPVRPRLVARCRPQAEAELVTSETIASIRTRSSPSCGSRIVDAGTPCGTSNPPPCPSRRPQMNARRPGDRGRRDPKCRGW